MPSRSSLSRLRLRRTSRQVPRSRGKAGGLRDQPGACPGPVPGGLQSRRAIIPSVPRVSVTIITLNEADHIAGAIESASWADEVVVVDSGSTDGTLDIARAKGAAVSTRAWTGYVDQKNHAASLASHDWVFSL